MQIFFEIDVHFYVSHYCTRWDRLSPCTFNIFD